MEEAKKERGFLGTIKTTHYVFAALVLIIILLSIGYYNAREAGITITETTRVLGSLEMDEVLTIPVDYADARVSGDIILIKTGSRQVNTSGTIQLQNYNGKIKWTGEGLVLKGTMDQLKGTNLDITWAKPEKVTITLEDGFVEVKKLSMFDLSKIASGRITLADKWTAQLEETKLKIKDFEGRVYLQYINNESTWGFDGTAENLQIKDDNLLKSLI